MDINELLIDVLVTFVMAFLVAAAVAFLWNLAAHGSGAFEWERSLHLAIILGIVLPLLKARQRNRSGT